MRSPPAVQQGSSLFLHCSQARPLVSSAELLSAAPGGSDRSYSFVRVGVPVVVASVGGAGKPGAIDWGLVKAAQKMPALPDPVRGSHRCLVTVDFNAIIWTVRVAIWTVRVAIWTVIKALVETAPTLIGTVKAFIWIAAIKGVVTRMFGAKWKAYRAKRRGCNRHRAVSSQIHPRSFPNLLNSQDFLGAHMESGVPREKGGDRMAFRVCEHRGLAIAAGLGCGDRIG